MLPVVGCFIGNRSSGGDRLDAFSAPTSPMGPPPSGGIGSSSGTHADNNGQQQETNGQANQQQNTILRNPLRGSKCN